MEKTRCATAIEAALASGISCVIDVEIEVTTPGYGGVWYPYPADMWPSKTGRRKLSRLFRPPPAAISNPSA